MAIDTLRSPLITTVQVLRVRESQPVALLMGVPRAAPVVSVTTSSTRVPSSNESAGQLVRLPLSVHENPFGPVTNPP